MTDEKGFGLFALLVSEHSGLSGALDAKLAVPGETKDTIWSFFLDQIRPFGISPAEFNASARASMETLWVDADGLFAPHDNTPDNVGEALSFVLRYDPGPCPVDQAHFMAALT